MSEDLNSELKDHRKQVYGDSVGDSLSIKGRGRCRYRSKYLCSVYGIIALGGPYQYSFVRPIETLRGFK